jgi:hypothetical protein
VVIDNFHNIKQPFISSAKDRMDVGLEYVGETRGTFGDSNTPKIECLDINIWCRRPAKDVVTKGLSANVEVFALVALERDNGEFRLTGASGRRFDAAD